MSKRRKVGIDDRIPMRIRPADRDLVIEETFADPDLTERMRLAETRGRVLVVRYTLSELDDLLGHIAAAANHADDRKLQTRLDDLYDRLGVYEDRYEDDLSGEPSAGDDARDRLLEAAAAIVDIVGGSGDRERRPKKKSRLTLPDAVREEVEPRLREYCDARFPEAIRDELRLGYRIEGAAVVLFEERPAFREPSRWLELPVAKFRYYAGLEEWRLLWRDRNSEWHFYDEVPPAKSLEPLLQEVDEDPTGIFWG